MKKNNTYLNNSCTDFFKNGKFIEKQDDLIDAIVSFNVCPDENNAKSVIKSFLSIYNVGGLEKLIDTMHCFENHAASLISTQRDHYIHSVYVFLLGISLYTKSNRICLAINDNIKYPDCYPSLEQEFLYRWGMASLFHDIGYPIEITAKIINEFSALMMLPNLVYENQNILSLDQLYTLSDIPIILSFNDISKVLHIDMLSPLTNHEANFFSKYSDYDQISLEDIFKLLSRYISLSLKINDEDLVYNEILSSVKDGLNKNRVDHAVYSSIMMLRWANEAFKKANWNPAYFYFPIVSAASAIFLHNSYRYIFRKPPFSLQSLKLEKCPLAYLLLLCDNLQETGRCNYGYEQKISVFDEMYIEFENENLEIYMQVIENGDSSIADKFIYKINDSIVKTLDIESAFESFKLQAK